MHICRNKTRAIIREIKCQQRSFLLRVTDFLGLKIREWTIKTELAVIKQNVKLILNILQKTIQTIYDELSKWILAHYRILLYGIHISCPAVSSLTCLYASRSLSNSSRVGTGCLLPPRPLPRPLPLPRPPPLFPPPALVPLKGNVYII